MKRIILLNLLAALSLILPLVVSLIGPPATVDAQGPTPDGLVLWNKLGSEDEVLNSEVGAGFGTRPGVIYVDGLYGGALATTGGETGGGGYLTMSPDDFFPADKTRGTVEVWIQKRIQRFIPYQTPLVTIFGHQYYSGIHDYQSIMGCWNDGVSGRGGLQLRLTDGGFTYHFANDWDWDNVPIHQWVHVAFVWDLDGIDGTSDKLRIYRDGIVTAANTDSIPDIMHDTRQVRILGHHAYSRFGEPTAYLDNIIVWKYAKTDFSDRFTESPIGEEFVPEWGSMALLSSGLMALAGYATLRWRTRE